MKFQRELKFLLSGIWAFFPIKVLAGTLDVQSVPPGTLVIISNSEREVDIDKEFFSLDPIDITFQIANDGLPNPDRFEFEEIVRNSTNINWTDYHLELGFLDEDGNFTRSGNQDLLDFGTTGDNQPDPLPNSDPFGQGQTSNDGNTLDYPPQPNIILPSGGLAEFNFSVDVPDTLPNNTFTLRQQPTVKQPEPTSTLSLVVLTTLGASSTLLRKKKHKSVVNQG